MLSDHHFASYKQYKADTHCIATWLATTIDKCSLVKSTHQAEGPYSRLSESKRKAKSPMLPAAGDLKQTSATHNSPRKKYVIDVKDFVPMARSIVSKGDPKIVVPGQLLEILDRGIELRKQVAHALGFGNGMGRNGDGQSLAASSTSEDAGHAYFTRVLEEVREVLRKNVEDCSIDRETTWRPRPRTPVDSRKCQPCVSGEDNSQINFQNIYTIIQHDDDMSAEYDTADEPNPITAVASSEASAITDLPLPNSPMLDSRKGFHELSLSYHCMFKDRENMRRAVQET